MTDDIVAWLRVVSDDYGMGRCEEAADEIERLRKIMANQGSVNMALMECSSEQKAEIERLRAALNKIANGPRDANEEYVNLFVELKLEARAALEGEKKDG